MKGVFAVVTLVLFAASSGFGQDAPRFEIYGGGAFLRDPDDFNRWGWVASFTGNMNEWFGIKGEVAGYYNDGDTVHTFLGGPQFTLRKSARIQPWAHFLAGLQHNDVSVFHILQPGGGALPFPRIVYQSTHFTWQPGGGVDVSLSRRVGLRFGMDYVRAMRDFRDVDHYRAHAGVVFKIP